MKLHLPKGLLTAVLVCVSAIGTTCAAVTYEEEVITTLNVVNVNFAGERGATANKQGEVSLPYGETSYTYEASSWYDVTGPSGSTTVTDTVGNAYTLSWNSNNTWSSNATDVSTDTLVGALTKGYLDMSSSGDSSASFTLTAADGSSLGWEQVNIILSGDGGSFSTVEVNGTNYYYNSEGVLQEGSGSWGTRQGAADLTEGVNMMCITNDDSTGSQSQLEVTGRNNGGRATIAGAQIVLGGPTEVATDGTISGFAEGSSAVASALDLRQSYGNTFTVNIEATTDIPDDVATLTLDQNLSVGQLSVSGGALRLEITEGNLLNIGAINRGDGASIRYSGGGNVVYSGDLSGFGEGEFILENGVTVSLSAKLPSDIAVGCFRTEEGTTLSIAGNYTAADDFKAAIDSFSGAGTLIFAAFQSDMQPGGSDFDLNIENKKIVFDGGLVLTGTSRDNEAQKLTIGTGSEVTVNSAVLESRRMNVNVEGGKLTANEGIVIGHPADGNYRGWVNLRDGEIITTSIKGQNNKGTDANDSVFTMTGGTLTITGENAFGLTAEDKNLAVHLQGGIITTTQSQMNLAENATNANLSFIIGKVTFDTGTGLAINLNHDYMQTGTLTVTGSGMLTISGHATLRDVQDLSAFGYADKTETGNGYAGSKRYLVMSDAANYTITGAVTYEDGSTVDYQTDNHGIYVTVEGNDYTYHINTGDVVYGETDIHNAAAERTTGISLNGGNLILDRGLTSQAMEGSGIVAYQTATVTINEGVSLSQSHLTANDAVLLDGAGTYALDNVHSLADNVSLADTWVGIVELSGADVNALNINNYANENSQVRLVGVSAWLAMNALSVNTNVILGNDAEGHSGFNFKAMSQRTYQFTKKISGSGDLEVSDTNNENATIRFSGDISEWTGKFLNTSGGTKTLDLQGDATEINAAIENAGAGTLGVLVNNDSDVTVNGTIKNTSEGSVALTTSGNGAKTFNDNVNITSASLSGGEVTFTKELTVNGDASIDGAATFNGSSLIEGNATFAGLTAINDGLTVNGTTTLIGGAASVSIADGATFTTGNETITNLQEGTAATISGTGVVSVMTEGLTYAGADITVNTAYMLNTAATLSNSRLTVTGGGSATAKVEEGSVNSFVATEGDVSVNTGSVGTAQVENLTVSGDKEASFVDANGDTATVAVSGTTALAEGSTVNGNLIITSSAKLQLDGASDTGDNAARINGTVTFAEGASLSLTNKVDATGITEDSAFVLAWAYDFVDVGNLTLTDVLVSGTLEQGMIAELTTITATQSEIATFALSRETEQPTMQQLVLSITAQAAPIEPGDLVATAVNTGYETEGNMLTIGINTALDNVSGDLAVTVDDPTWNAIKASMGGDSFDETAIVSVSLKGSDGTVLDLATYDGSVSFNGYAGTGEKGQYVAGCIPEPATATLSLLALAALAARRRRKH